MTLAPLDNLVKIGQLKVEPPDQAEFAGMVGSANRRLHDAQIESLSEDSRFSLAYGAAHALALAAPRWHGYRSESRYLVSQCLQHTVGLDTVKWRVLDNCHKQRNLAEYEGHSDVSPQLLKELIDSANELLGLVEALGPVEQAKKNAYVAQKSSASRKHLGYHPIGCGIAVTGSKTVDSSALPTTKVSMLMYSQPRLNCK